MHPVHLVMDNAALLLAESEGVLSASEAFALESIAQRDGEVPEDLYDAVERLFLWICATDETIH
jgi:type III secretion system FlhB-like substrate exporter